MNSRENFLPPAAGSADSGPELKNPAAEQTGSGNDQTDRAIERLNTIVNSSDNIVFFGGAGVSTESGIPDFRGAAGIYAGGRENSASAAPELMISHTYYKAYPEEFFDFYRKKMLYLDAEPNAAHLKLTEMERAGRLRAVVTQNIDGLHQKAGSKNVIELHGSVHRNYCVKCNAEYSARFVAGSVGVPRCVCGGTVKPDVVLYEESLDDGAISRALSYIGRADVLIIGGTSLVVHPAAGLVRYYRGRKLIIINKSGTDSDDRALLVIREGIAGVMSRLTITARP